MFLYVASVFWLYEFNNDFFPPGGHLLLTDPYMDRLSFK